MFLFNKEEVYVGFSIEEFSKVRQSLAMGNIKYKYNVVSQSGQWGGLGSSRGHYGSFGVNMKYDKQYYVYVMKKDYEQASYLVNKALHG